MLLSIDSPTFSPLGFKILLLSANLHHLPNSFILTQPTRKPKALGQECLQAPTPLHPAPTLSCSPPLLASSLTSLRKSYFRASKSQTNLDLRLVIAAN